MVVVAQCVEPPSAPSVSGTSTVPWWGTYKLLHFSGEGGEGGKQAAVANC